MCACDLAIAAEDARLGLSEVRWDILPAVGATYLPAQTIGRRDFLEASLTGRDFDGEHAEELSVEVTTWAEEITDLNPRVVQTAKEVYTHEMESNPTIEAAVSYELVRNRQLRGVTGGEDVKAIEAFRDKKFRPGVESDTEEDIAAYED